MNASAAQCVGTDGKCAEDCGLLVRKPLEPTQAQMAKENTISSRHSDRTKETYFGTWPLRLHRAQVESLL